MKLGVIDLCGSQVSDFEKNITDEVTEIITGSGEGIEGLAREYAALHNIKLHVYVSEYKKFRKGTQIKEIIKIIKSSDSVIVFWNGKPGAIRHVIKICKQNNVSALLRLL